MDDQREKSSSKKQSAGEEYQKKRSEKILESQSIAQSIPREKQYKKQSKTHEQRKNQKPAKKALRPYQRKNAGLTNNQSRDTSDHQKENISYTYSNTKATL